MLDDDIKLDGYYDKPFKKDRNCFGGGVLVYASTTLKVKLFADDTSLSYSSTNLLQIERKLNYDINILNTSKHYF